MLLMVNPNTGDAVNIGRWANDAPVLRTIFQSFVRDGWLPVGPKSLRVAAVILVIDFVQSMVRT